MSNTPESIAQFVQRLTDNPAGVAFEQSIEVINRHYDYTPTAFRNGLGDDAVVNTAGSNEGSCRIFAFAQLQQLTPAQTLACFGRFYREEVLQHPAGTDHANIRHFMRHGWAGITFEDAPLRAKAAG
jgi:hypothetical protein